LYGGAEESVTPEELLGALAKDLGYLPLALAHASAYIREEQTQVTAYRALFADYRSRLETLFVRSADFPDPYLDTLETTWAISVELADRLAAGGAVPVVMALAALLDPDGIPRAVFTTEAVANYLDGVLGRPVPEREILAAVRVLHRLNLLTDDPVAQAEPVISVHALVQRATRDAQTTQAPQHDEAEGVAWAAGDALLEIWPDIERNTELRQSAAIQRAGIDWPGAASIVVTGRPRRAVSRRQQSDFSRADGKRCDLLRSPSHSSTHISAPR
jgi:hypothetical protein